MIFLQMQRGAIMEKLIRDLMEMLYGEQSGLSAQELSVRTEEPPINILCGISALRMCGIPIITECGRFILPDPIKLKRWSRDNPRLACSLVKFALMGNGHEKR